MNNMQLRGFDAPVEQVMYLDKIIVAHGLLQAIARVNRVGGDSKEKGFVVDYVGIGHHFHCADQVARLQRQRIERKPETVHLVASRPPVEMTPEQWLEAASALVRKH